jgi:hypothetical protein
MSSRSSARPTVLLVGLGDLGGVTLELLAREPAVGRIVVGSRNEAAARARCNLARAGAAAQGFDPRVEFVRVDLHEIEATAETIARVAPDLILCTATMHAWWLADLLPPEAAAIRRAPFGVWLPVNSVLARKLMEAVRAADYRGVVLSAPFPDVVNVALDRIGLAPTCGVGNVDESATKVQIVAADRLGARLDEVRVTLVAHHALEKFSYDGSADELPPHFLRVEFAGKDVTSELGGDELIRVPYPLPPGRPKNSFTAGSTVRLIRAMLGEDETRLHAPGPGGRPGGYPILAGRGAVRLAPIEGLSEAEAIDINERSHRFEGIERIEADGTVLYTDAAAGAIRETIGYDCRRLAPDDAEPRARELIRRYAEYARRFGVEA